MSAPGFALIGFDTDKVLEYVLDALAVGGAFLLGYSLVGAIAWLLDKWITGGKSPPGVRRIARILGGLALAILVALMLFNRGGGGTGTGPRAGGPAEKGEGPGGPTQTQPTNTEVNANAQTSQDTTPPEQRVKVTVLGGEQVKDEQFYQIGDDRTPQKLAKVAEAVEAKQKATKKPVGIAIRIDPNNPLPPDHAAILQLQHWGRAHNVAVTILPPDKPQQ